MTKDEILARYGDILVDQLGVEADERQAGKLLPG